MKRFFGLGLLLVVAACGGSLSQAGAAVKVMKADPPQGCTEVGAVSGRAIGPDHIERSKNGMRNEAAEKGGNYVRLENLDTENGYAAGTAFKCP